MLVLFKDPISFYFSSSFSFLLFHSDIFLSLWLPQFQRLLLFVLRPSSVISESVSLLYFFLLFPRFLFLLLFTPLIL